MKFRLFENYKIKGKVCYYDVLFVSNIHLKFWGESVNIEYSVYVLGSWYITAREIH